MQKVFLLGATGYIGSRLLREIRHQGYLLRCGARVPRFLVSKIPEDIEVVAADCLEPDSLESAMQGCHTAIYLVHSLGVSQGTDFEALETTCAQNFVRAAGKAGIQKILYLGGLGHGPDLSAHLRSRQEVGRILASTGIAVIEFRASIILGAGSLSYELVRALCERLPIMTCPSWVESRAQPIGVWSVLEYFLAALKTPVEGHKIYEIGGSEEVSYLDIMREYSHQRGLKRTFIPLPFLTPYLSSLWLGLVTPVYSRVGRKLIDSLKNPTTVKDPSAQNDFPQVQLQNLRSAIGKAVADEEQESRQTRWSDAISSKGHRRHWAGVRFGNRIVDSHSLEVQASDLQAAFEPVRTIGGKQGWYYANFLWKIRGFLDLLVGGVGIRRGRADARQLAVGDTVDWWRVEEYDPPHHLRLYAEMKTPGRAWLEFRVHEIGDGRYCITQNAIFDPIGLWGLLYWYSLYPLHGIIFKGMLREMARRVKT